MATVQKFEDLAVWSQAREFVGLLYKHTSRGAFSRDFGLRDQLRRASVTVISNIAESFERAGNKKLDNFQT